MDLYLFFSWIPDISILIPLFLIIKQKYYLNKEHTALTCFVIITMLRNFIGMAYNILSLYNEEIRNMSNLFLYNWHCIIGFYLISYLYYTLIRNKVWKKAIMLIWLIFGIVSLLDTQNGTLSIGTRSFNKYSFSVAALLILTVILAYMYEVLKDLMIDDIMKFPYFWLSSGFISYFGGTLLMFLYLLNSPSQQGQLAWVFDSLLTLILNGAIFITIWYSNVPSQKKKIA